MNRLSYHLATYSATNAVTHSDLRTARLHALLYSSHPHLFAGTGGVTACVPALYMLLAEDEAADAVVELTESASYRSPQPASSLQGLPNAYHRHISSPSSQATTFTVHIAHTSLLDETCVVTRCLVLMFLPKTLGSLEKLFLFSRF